MAGDRREGRRSYGIQEIEENEGIKSNIWLKYYPVSYPMYRSKWGRADGASAAEGNNVTAAKEDIRRWSAASGFCCVDVNAEIPADQSRETPLSPGGILD